MKSDTKVFDKDVAANAGYVYTTNDRLSSQLWAQRMEDLILESTSLEGKKVLDVGCGDGFFTERYCERGQPQLIVGVDPTPNAIAVATDRINGRPMHFCVGDGNRLPWPDDSFDLVLLLVMLHHDDNPLAIIREAFRLAPEVVILEPNGNNLGLKVIEKVSRYHREHHEKSYSSARLLRWVAEAGGTVVHKRFGNFVPIFCPDWAARMLKRLEPVVERVPVVNALAAGVLVIAARR